MKCYKLFRVYRGRLTSCVVSPRGYYFTKYKRRSWNKSKVGYFFIFKTLYYAKMFAEGFVDLPNSDKYEYELWECEAKIVRKVRNASYTLTKRDIDSFWEYYNMEGWRTPDGTYGAKRVKLIRKVSYEV